jgi:hypothetical protein
MISKKDILKLSRIVGWNGLAALAAVALIFVTLYTHHDSKSYDLEQVAKNINIEQLADIIATKIEPIYEDTLTSKLNKVSATAPPAKTEEPKNISACIMLAAKTYAVPPAVLVGIYKVKNGSLGEEYKTSTDNHYEIGLMRINSSLLPELATKWNVNEEKVKELLKNDPCTNFGVSAWLLRRYVNESGDLSNAIILYGGGEDGGDEFKEKVINEMRAVGLLKESSTSTPQS